MIDVIQTNDCILSYIKNKVNEMIRRTYDAKRIYEQLAPFIENPSPNKSIQCYDNWDNVISCLPDRICSINYDQNQNKVIPCGITMHHIPEVFMYRVAQ